MVTSQKTVRYEVHTIESAPAGGGEALAGLKAAVGSYSQPRGDDGRVAGAPEGLPRPPAALREARASRPWRSRPCRSSPHTRTAARGAWPSIPRWGSRRAWTAPSRGRAAVGASPRPTAASAPSPSSRARWCGRADTSGATRSRTFLAAGFTKRQALDVVLGMGFSLLANYAGHLTEPPLDEFLRPHAWSR